MGLRQRRIRTQVHLLNLEDIIRGVAAVEERVLARHSILLVNRNLLWHPGWRGRHGCDAEGGGEDAGDPHCCGLQCVRLERSESLGYAVSL